jgi:hypothetical protein
MQRFIWFCCACCAAWLQPVAAAAQEVVSTTPALADGVLFIASSERPGHFGHLRALDIAAGLPVRLWDAAERVPAAAARNIFTDRNGALYPFDAAHAEELQQALGVTTTAAAQALVNAARGRSGCDPAQPSGRSDTPQRLWAIGRADPLLLGRGQLDRGAVRDRLLFVGAEDGMLHALLAGRWDNIAGRYLADGSDAGSELWAYLPGSLLPSLSAQPFDDAAGEAVIELDGSPLAGEFFVDLDGDGRRRWHTLLAATATDRRRRRSSLFVLDVSDPAQPRLLWQQPLPGTAVGRSRGLALGPCGDSASCLYLTADAGDSAGQAVHALAIELLSGRLRWQFSAAYSDSGGTLGATPAPPALLDRDGDGDADSLVFGDLAGRLWALELSDGQALGGAPLFTTPGGVQEPIGGGVAVAANQIVFGSGGVAGADSSRRYALYAVELYAAGGRLLWRLPLAAGEQVWRPPAIDAAGNLIFTTAIDYAGLPTQAGPASRGRIIALDRNGEELTRRETAANLGRALTDQGLTLVIDVNGTVTQFGHASRLDGPDAARGTVRLLSWRQR